MTYKITFSSTLWTSLNCSVQEIKLPSLWDVTGFGVVYKIQCFGGVCGLYLQDSPKKIPLFFNYVVKKGRKLTPKYRYLYHSTLQRIPGDFNLQHRH